MRKFVDLHVRALFERESSASQASQLMALLGFSMVGLSFPSGLGRDRMERVARIFRETGLDPVMRTNLRPSSRNELLRILRKVRSQFEVVAVECTNPRVSQVAVRDRRVDLVYFSPENRPASFRTTLARMSHSALEVNLSHVLRSELSHSVISRLSENLRAARDSSVPVVVSSGASSPLELRGPREMIAVISLLSDRAELGPECVSTVPRSIVERNRGKLASEYVEEGVRLVRAGSRHG